MILFSAIEFEQCETAYHWHRGFAGANDALYPRQYDEFQSLVMEGSVWAARDARGNYLALAYASYDEEKKECEVGGLMVATQARGKGLGATIMRLALAHALVEENLLSISGVRVIAHVLKSNNDPRKIIEEKLYFRHSRSIKIPASELPGLRAEGDSYVHGDEFEIDAPKTLAALAEWARQWPQSADQNNPAHVELRHGVSLFDWAEALNAMAKVHVS